MLVINEEDVGKSRDEILTELIYESTKQFFPVQVITHGNPQELDIRTDNNFDANTYISVRIDRNYDTRYGGKPVGFLYRRRNITSHCRVYDFSKVQPKKLPFKIADILDQINEVMPYPLALDDLVNHTYATVEQARSIKLTASKKSLLWIGEHQFEPDVSLIEPYALFKFTLLNGFNLFGFGNTYPAAA